MKNLRTIATAIITLVLFSNSATAQSTTSPANEAFSVKYIGNDEGYILFQVAVNSVSQNFTLLKINDKIEGEIYSKSYKKGTKLTTFKIEKKDAQELSFILLTGKKVYTKTFHAATHSIKSTIANENIYEVVAL